MYPKIYKVHQKSCALIKLIKSHSLIYQSDYTVTYSLQQQTHDVIVVVPQLGQQTALCVAAL